MVTVHADLRWPAGTGIGVVQRELLTRVPHGMRVLDLSVPGRIGSPCSPWAIARSLRRAGPGIAFWSPGFMPPSKSTLPCVVTVHDLTHLHFYSRLHAAYYDTVMKSLYRRCRAIICVSEFTRREFIGWSGMSPAKVFTVHNGVARDLFAGVAEHRPGYDYVLYPGNQRTYKNLDRLLAAFSASTLPRSGIHLVMTGALTPALRQKVMALGLSERVHAVGQVSSSELAGLYRGALLIAFVSLYEGFGLPIIEGMAAGTPVLTSSVAAMPEIAGEAALIVDPHSVSEISAALNRLVTDGELRQTLIDRGRIRATQFDWDATAASVWDIVTNAAA